MIFGIISIIFVFGIIAFLLVSFFITIFFDAPFVPTPYKAVHKVLEAAKIKKNDIVYDLGAGDGRFLHFAEKTYGAKATGFELDPFVYWFCKFKQLFLKRKGTIKRQNFHKENFSNADVIVCYLMPRTLKKMQKKFVKEMKKGSRIVSYTFSIGTLKPFKMIPKKDSINKIFVYKF